ncbi:T9SS type A sorting domain-containing protein [Halocola ammonii]
MKALLSIFIFITISLSATSQNYFWNHYGGEFDDVAYDVQQTSDLGFVLSGRSGVSVPELGSGLYMVKTDSEGNEEWSQTYLDTDVELGSCVHQTADLGYIVSGFTDGNVFDGSTFSLTKLNSEGVEEWTKEYDLLTFGLGENLIITEDDGFIITGHVVVDSYQQIKVIKTDNQGNVIWSQIYESEFDQFAESIVRTNDGGYAVCGDSGNYVGSDVILLKIDENGELIWDEFFVGNGGEAECFSLDTTSDNGFVIYGTSIFTDEEVSNKCLLIKTDSEGIQEWQETYYTLDGASGRGVKAVGNNGYIMTGYAIDNTQQVYLMYCIKTDPLGSTEWEQIFVESQTSRGRSCTITQDGGFAFAGSANITDITYQAYLVKTNSSGTLNISSPESTRSKTSVYPNPFSNSATIFLSLSADKRFDLQVLDSHGKIVRSLENVPYRHTFDRGKLNSGIYYYKVLEDGSFYDSGKFIIQ